MTSELLGIEAPSPDQADSLAAEKLTQTLADQLAQGKSPTVILACGESDHGTVLPMTAAMLLVKILSEIAKGNAVAVVPIKP